MMAVADVVTVRTDDLDAKEVDAIRRLLDSAFGGRFDEHDWAHAIGGHHAIVRVAGAIVGHGAVVPRTMWIGGDEHQVGYVEAVATAPDAQGRGVGTTVMHALAEVIEQHHTIAVLSTGAWHFYARLGWQRWQGPTSVRRSDGTVERTPDEDDGVMTCTHPVGAIDLHRPITCAERAGDDW